MTQNLSITGEMLKELRIKAHLSLEQIGNMEPHIISASYLSQIETGKIKKPSYDTMMKLLKLYHVNITIDL